MKRTLLITLFAIALSAIYFIFRMQATNNANRDSDVFFAKFSSADQEFIINHFNLVDQNPNDALAIMEKHKAAIANFDYKGSAPTLNLTLDEASVDVSWHLKIIFKRKNHSWYITKFVDYGKD